MADRDRGLRWASLQVENEPDAAELSPIYDFNTRRDHWREWRSFSRGRRTRWAQILVWLILSVLTLTFFFLYISERYDSASANVVTPVNSASSKRRALFPSDTGYTPFKHFQLNVDYRGVERTQTSSKGMVTSDNGECSDMGGEILKKGGNAIDAAVTTVLCIGLRDPFSSGTGGGAFILVRLSDGKKSVIDAREVAPGASSKNLFKGQHLELQKLYQTCDVGHAALDAAMGGLSIAVPMELKGLEMMWKNNGQLSWADLIEPVIPLARDGFPATPQMVMMITRALVKQGGTYVFDDMKEIFFIPGDGAWRLPNVGETCCKRPALAKTLSLVAKKGVQAVYDSEWGDDLIEDIRNLPFPGILRKKDLVEAKPTMKEPIRDKLFGMDVFTVPPPSSAPTLVMALKLLETYTDHTSETLNYHRMVEAMKHMAAVRSHFGDPGVNNTFLDLDHILEDIAKKSFIRDLRQRLKHFIMGHNWIPCRKDTSDSGVQDSSVYGGKYSADADGVVDGGTSHICTADTEGNAVSITTSVNWAFGSFMVSKKTGLLLNNHMDDFSKPGTLPTGGKPQSVNKANLIYPGRKPLSSMSPLIFEQDGQLKLVMGATGGRAIITALLQVIYMHFGLGIDLEEALYLPRVADFLTGNTFFECTHKGPLSFTLEKGLIKALGKLGHEMAVAPFISCVLALEVDEEGHFRGIPDPRKDSAAASNL